MSTDRTAFGGDHLTAKFNAQVYGGRLEGGYRLPMGATTGFTPYAAVQSQRFHTPAYSETDLSGGGFGLSYASRGTTDTRSELGARLDDRMAIGDGRELGIRARMAWAHDWVGDNALQASFLSLPGASFTVTGARAPRDSVLASLGSELLLTRAISVGAKFDTQLARGSQTYAGLATLRYRW
jgi:outer membrane autotransporter protein